MTLRAVLRHIICAFFVWAGGFRTTQAQFVISDSIHNTVSIQQFASLFEASSINYTVNDFIQNPGDFQFQKITKRNQNLGFTDKYYWVRFSLHNATAEQKKFILETAKPIIDSVILYTIDKQQIIQQQYSGDAVAFNERAIKHRKTLFEIELLPQQTLQYYIKIKTDGESLMLPLKLHTPRALLKITYKEQLLYGFFYGILLLAAIIYMFFFFALQGKTFLYYSLYVAFIGLLQFALDGFFYQYISPNGGWLYNRSILLTATVGAFFLGKYSESFLDVPKHFKKIHWGYQIMYVILIINFIALLTIPAYLSISYTITNALGLIVLILIVLSLLRAAKKRIRVDPYFITGILFLILGFVILILSNFDTISNSFLSENAPKLGTGLEVIFLSISMSNRIKLLRLENENNQKLALQRFKDMNDIKSLFLSNISHELRTPLNLIMGATSSLHYTTHDVSLKEKYEMILGSSKSLLRSIEDILNFTVIEKGGHLVKKQSFKLSELIELIQNETRMKANAKGLTFELRQVGFLPESIISDRLKLTQILSNLLDNAVKFTEKGKVTLSIISEWLNDDKAHFTFIISDTGISISEDKMKTVFESFTKKSFDDKRTTGGLGLGLYIAKTYLDLMEGEISIHNKTHGGIECKVMMTFDIDRKPQVKQTDDLSHEPTNFNLGACQILLIEDNPMNQMVIEMMVSKWQHAGLEFANNGKEGIAKLQSNTYDVVLMDLQMPVMDGFETIAAIRGGLAGVSNIAIPIIAVTADVTEKTKNHVFDLGVSDYMTKPVDANLLLKKIKTLI